MTGRQGDAPTCDPKVRHRSRQRRPQRHRDAASPTPPERRRRPPPRSRPTLAGARERWVGRQPCCCCRCCFFAAMHAPSFASRCARRVPPRSRSSSECVRVERLRRAARGDGLLRHRRVVVRASCRVGTGGSCVLILAGAAASRSSPACRQPLDPKTSPRIWKSRPNSTVIVALFGAGLRIDNIATANWRPTWRLLVLALPLTVLALAWIGWAVAGLTLAGAVLLAAVLSPTDPCSRAICKSVRRSRAASSRYGSRSPRRPA